MKSKQFPHQEKLKQLHVASTKTLSTFSFITVLQYTVYLKYRNSKPVKLQRPKCIPKVESTISQRVSCAPHTAHLPSLLQPFPAFPEQSVTLFKQHYFFLRALFPSPFFGFSFPRSFFNRLISSLKS